MPTPPTQADPVAALRAVLTENAKVKHLEEENAYLRKHNASAELDAVQDALNEHPASPDIGDLSMAEQVRQIIKWWDETEVENNDAHNALDELGAPDKGTPAKRIRALAVAKDRQIAELEAKVRALPVERSGDIQAIERPPPHCPRCLESIYIIEETAYCPHCHWEGKAMLVDDGVNVVIVPDPPQHLPCPFCGGKATVHSAIDASIAPKVERWNATPSCGECGATGPSAVGDNHTESIANAWAAWDRRGGAR